jgi:hypothetical protein
MSGVETNQIFDAFDSFDERKKDRQQKDSKTGRAPGLWTAHTRIRYTRYDSYMVQVYSIISVPVFECASIISVLFEDIFENGS